MNLTELICTQKEYQMELGKEGETSQDDGKKCMEPNTVP